VSEDARSAYSERRERLPLHPAQTGLIAAKSQGHRGVNCTCIYRISGNLYERRLTQSYKRALAEFDSLRLVLTGPGQHFGWRQADGPRAQVRRRDLRRAHIWEQGQPSATFLARLQRHGDRDLDLRVGLIGLVEILRVAANEWIVTETFAHAVADDRSLALLHEAVAALYRDPARPQRYPGYIPMLAKVSRPQPASMEYWRHSFDGYEPPPVATHGHGTSAATWQLSLGADRSARLERAAGHLRGTVASALVAAHAHALARHLGTGDIVTHVAFDSRDAACFDVFGQLTTLVPVRVRHDWSAALGRHVSAVARQLLVTRGHLDIDVEQLDQLHVPVGLSRPDATAFVMQDIRSPVIDLPGVTVSTIGLRSSNQVGGLITVARRHPDGLIHLSLRAPEGSHVAGLVAGIGETVNVALRSLETDPHVTLGSDALLSDPARTLIERVATPSPPYPFIPVDVDILANLTALGDRPILDDDRTYAAAELLRRAHGVMTQLRDLGVVAGDAVTVGDLQLIDRIGAFIAILAMGAVYVPFDVPILPAEVDRMEARAQAVARITAHGAARRGSAERANKICPLGPQSPAYVIFTSGTTGVGKGVVVSRAALSNLVRGEAERFGIDADSRVLLVAPPIVDPWICHVTAALLWRATIVRVDPMSDRSLAECLQDGRVTHAFLPAALLRSLDTRELPELQMIATAGDYCRARDLKAFRGTKVYNIYGPTEATVTATVAEVGSVTDPVPIGRPIRGMGARVVIDHAASAPPGVPGELMLSGAGVALGYLDDEALNRASFRVDPFDPRERWYLTGDQAWLREDGNLVLSGRVDRQVKVRGTRIEPEYIEAAARATGLCIDAHVKTFALAGSIDKLLVLFVEGCREVEALTSALRTRLPRHAWPHHVAATQVLPRRASGKVAEELLPAEYPQAAGRDSLVSTTAPAGVLGRLWTEVLGVPPSPRDQFFSVGGDSLNVLRFVRQARAAGIPLSPADVYTHPRYADLDELCRERAPQRSRGQAEPVPETVAFGPSQQWFLAMDLANPRWWNQRHAIAFLRLPSKKHIEDALTILLEATPILRSSVDLHARRLVIRNAQAVSVDVLPSSAPDMELVRAIEDLNRGIDHLGGVMVRALAVRGEHGDGVLVLVAHHLVVDTWSWHVLEERLRRILDAQSGLNVPSGTDHGFAVFSRAVKRQRDIGAFSLDSDPWANVLASGRTADIGTRPRRLERLMHIVGHPGQMTERWGTPSSRVLLAALGHAWRATEGTGATVIDLERNGRAAIHGLDLSDAVGWIALHHPVPVDHAALTQDTIEQVSADVDGAPDLGLSYGALRWPTRAGWGSHVGRFAVNISDRFTRISDGRDDLYRRVRDLPVSLTGGNHLPYEATLTFLRGPSRVTAILDHDPERIGRKEATALLKALADAAQSRPNRTRWPVKRSSETPFDAPVPASAMQRLMLHHAGSGPAFYRPRQLLAVQCARDADDLLDALSAFLGDVEPFRRRFRAMDEDLLQVWLPAGQQVPIRRFAGGHREGLAWLNGPDHIDSEAALMEGPLVDVVAFVGAEGLTLGLEVHHALMDGMSNRILVRLLDRFVEYFHDKAPLPSVPSLSHNRQAVRKHVACELSIGSLGPVANPATRVLRPPPPVVDIVLPKNMMQRVDDWARRHSLDTRASLAAVVGRVVQRALNADDLYVVGNGRDIDVPESAEALGMFWYFQPVALTGHSIAALAAAVHTAARKPLTTVRSAALHWPDWSPDGVSCNVTKQEVSGESLSMIRLMEHRDLFHFGTQIHVLLRADGSALIRCASTGNRDTAQRLLDRVVAQLTATVGGEA
jgi:non-ribosomal peptide synthetase component F